LSGAVPEPPCELLPWDTDFWGFPVARVRSTSLSEPAAVAVDEWCASERIACAYLLADAEDPETARVAPEHGWHYVDSRVTMVRRPPPNGPASGPEPGIRDARAEDEPALRAIAEASHTNTRFFFDGRFDLERCRELYGIWIAESVRDPDTRVLVADDGGGLAGYVTIARKEGPEIDLIAVAEGSRERGVGTALVKAAIDSAASEGIAVVTQGRNVAALRLYESLGFLTDSVGSWYHKWYERG
jgi:dTDP-4-amino-4,6-dideoxy-D-galactose acyltransferase